MILVIDNYDSFVHNLARYFRQLGLETKVVRNDRITLADIEALSPTAIVLSPGPCTPDEAGICLEVVKALASSVPLLGICLGHQAIIQAFGGMIVPAIEPMHGRQSQVFHRGSPMFDSVPSPFSAGRYHSLIGSPARLPACLKGTAFTDDRTIMAIEHQEHPVVGLQFHPESILTVPGYQLLANFLAIAGVPVDASIDLGRLARDQTVRTNPSPDNSSGSLDHGQDRPYPISPRLSRSEPS